MTKEDIVKQYAEVTKQPYYIANMQVTTMLQTIANNLVKGENVSLYAFGKFEPVHRKSCNIKSVKFTPSATIKELLNNEV